MVDIKAIAEELLKLTEEECKKVAEIVTEKRFTETTYCQDIYETGLLSFSSAIWALKNGKPICRRGWNGKGMFVIKQVPAHITEDIIPKMQSLPQSAKDILMSRENPHIDYTNQLLLIQKDGRADSWAPSSSDILAEDWMVYVEPKEKEE